MMMPILYSFRRCPYAMRARMALLVSGIDFELREVALGRKPAEMIAVSAKATVPVLVLDDGRVIDESLDIMRWALGIADPEDWLAGDDGELIADFDDRFKVHLDGYKYPGRAPSEPMEHRDEGAAMLRGLEARLTAGGGLCGARRSLTDVAIMPFVRQFAAVDAAWFGALPLPRVRDWLARHVGSALFERAMLRVKPWTPGDVPVSAVGDHSPEDGDA